MPTSGVLPDISVQPGTDSRSLPEGYGVTMAALLPRDPDWMFCYWEITPDSRARSAREHGSDVFERSRQVLRVYDLSSPSRGEPRHFDVPVMLDAGNWYVHVPGEARTYCCEPGLVLPSGEFIGIVKSNTVTLPAGGVSDASGERWMAVSPDFEKLLQLSGVEYIGKGSGEVAKSLAQRWEMLRSVFSRASAWGVSSLSSRSLVRPAGRTFRLAADCELILYGATEPDAFVTVGGRRVKLNPDGTFSMRFALPGGTTDLPVSAVSSDGAGSRRVGIRVTRQAGRGGNGGL